MSSSSEIILHLETSTKVCSVALSKEGKLLVLHETDDSKYEHGEKLTLLIEQCLLESNLLYSDLAAVSIASGPGSYTGLRIGVSTAKGLCYGLKIPLIAIDALQSLTAQVVDKYKNLNLCALIDARRMEVFNCIYNNELTPLKAITADIIDETTYSDFEPFVYFGDGAEKLKEIWTSDQRILDDSIHASAVGQVKLAYDKLKNKDYEDLAYFEPFYLKEFVALKKKNIESTN